MKKILFFLLMLCCMTAAWAGEGNGTKEHPYTGEWQASELGPELEIGKYLAFDCVIKDGSITVVDTRLHKTVAYSWPNWSPGNLIDNPQDGSPYVQYGKDNLPANRKSQSFILTDVSPSAKTSTEFTIRGYFTGFYTTPDADGFVYVESAEQMWIILRGNSNVQANAHAKIQLTQDIYMSDIADGTYCSTFYGTLDGNGHTIHGSHDGTREAVTYLFTYADSAIIKNLNFRDIRIDNRDHHNQCVITSQAKNKCVFENITFDNVSIYTSYDNAGAVTGYATTNCTFTNITVKNSDITANKQQSGAVVGHAMNCNFSNINVVHCESTARNEKAGGVAGRSDNCTFEDIEVHDSFIESYNEYAGGIAGYSSNSKYSNCCVDDQAIVYSKGYGDSYTGGIAGTSDHDVLVNCIHSGVVAGFAREVGGIVGNAENNTKIENCLNTGIVMCINDENMQKFRANLYDGLPIVKRPYNGKMFDVRTNVADAVDYKSSAFNYGGIVGKIIESSISRCANIGFMACWSINPDNKDIRYTAGITGFALSSSISDCLSAPLMDDFNIISNGILGNAGMEDKANVIKNCLSIPTPASNIFYKNECIVSENNYSNCGEDAEFGVGITNDYFLSKGELVAKLGSCWEQNLGTDPYPTPTGNRGLYHTRKVSNQYGTACLPFPVKSDDKISYYTLSRKEDEDEGQEIKLVFSYQEDVIQEGTPVLFRSAEAEDANADELPVEICFNNAGDGFTYFPLTLEGDSPWEMSGAIIAEKVFEGDAAKRAYYVSNGEIKNASKVTIAPYRAYLLGPSIEELMGNGSSKAKAIRFVLEDEDGQVAALEFVGDDLMPVQQSGKTYSLMGTEVGEGYRGLVIKNGKPVFVK